MGIEGKKGVGVGGVGGVVCSLDKNQTPRRAGRKRASVKKERGSPKKRDPDKTFHNG
jgi:hypothetical protein